jgi:hypothetical protein
MEKSSIRRALIKPVAALMLLFSGLSLTAAPAANAWLASPSTQYPSAGGRWDYGFWLVKVRSYYTVSKVHGSTVEFNGSQVRSICTASGQKSIAEKGAYDAPWNDDRYYYRSTC